jgi:hypothetical protein
MSGWLGKANSTPSGIGHRHEWARKRRGVHQWRLAGVKPRVDGKFVADIPSIEHDFRRILNSRRSRVETTKMAEWPF